MRKPFAAWNLTVALGLAMILTPPLWGQIPEELPALVVPAAAQANSPMPEVLQPPTRVEDAADPDCCCASIWSKVPPVRIFPRQGNFPIPPTGPGYYSLRDVIAGNYRQAPPKFPYPPFALMPPSFFDADFRYLDDPNNTQHDLFDPLHRLHLGDNWLFATGGQVWWRHMNEVNSRLSGANNNYDLYRVRVFGDLWYRDQMRFYVELLHADSLNQNLAPLPIDVDHADLLNLFVDWKLMDIADHPAYVRVGRQEILLGSQRLISTLDWANTRRTFQGVRAFRQGEKFDVDLFWLQPVLVDPTHPDRPDHNRNFGGLWTTYRAQKGRFFDLYYLFLDNTDHLAQRGITVAPYNVHTLGTRYAGDLDNRFLWDVELDWQFGRRGGQDIVAGAAAAGVGYHLDRPMNPTFWVYYDYASGDHTPNAGNNYSTFNQLFPFSHYYLGWVDAVARQNIHDFNLHLFLYPVKWITVWGQYHHFWLDSSTDALYSAAGNAARRDATGVAGTNVGDELDFIINFHLGPHSDVLLGYSKLFQGNYLSSTGPGPSPELFFAQYSYRW